MNYLLRQLLPQLHRGSLYLLCGFLCAVHSLTAQPAGSQDSTYYPQLHTYARPNGMTVLVVRDPTVPLATAMVALRGGRASQLPPFGGVPVVLYELLAQPDANVATNREVFAKGRELGLQYFGELQPEHMHLGVTLQKAQLAKGLNFLAGSFANPQFSELEIRKKILTLADRATVTEANPVRYLQDELDQKLWAPYAESKSASLDYRSARAATPNFLRVYVERFFTTNNLLLVVGGDVDTTQVLALADSLFRPWRPEPEPLPAPTAYAPLARDSAWLAINELARTPVLMAAWQLPGTTADAGILYKGSCMRALLQVPGTPLDKALLQSGLASDLRVQFVPGRSRSHLQLTVVPNPFQVKPCLDSLRAHLKLLPEPGYFSEADVTNAAGLLETERVYVQETNSTLCAVLAGWWALGVLPAYESWPEEINKLNLTTAQQWLRQYISTNAGSYGLSASSEFTANARLDRYIQYWNHPPKVTSTQLATDSSTVAALQRNQLQEETAESFGRLLYKPDPILGKYTLFFKLGKQELDSLSFEKIRGLADYLEAHPAARVFVDGHADRTGSRKFNYKLSLERAAQVCQILVKEYGISPWRVQTRGFGETRLLYDDPDPALEALNRRVEFTPDVAY